jgi:hypothetical protein
MHQQKITKGQSCHDSQGGTERIGPKTAFMDAWLRIGTYSQPSQRVIPTRSHTNTRSGQRSSDMLSGLRLSQWEERLLTVCLALP